MKKTLLFLFAFVLAAVNMGLSRFLVGIAI